MDGVRQWDGMGRDGWSKTMGWDGMGRDGWSKTMGWDGTGWDGMGWADEWMDGRMGWDGIGRIYGRNNGRMPTRYLYGFYSFIKSR